MHVPAGARRGDPRPARAGARPTAPAAGPARRLVRFVADASVDPPLVRGQGPGADLARGRLAERPSSVSHPLTCGDAWLGGAMDSPDVKQAATRPPTTPALEAAARVGLRHERGAAPAHRVDHAAGRLRRRSGKNADQSGALASLAGNGAGKAALWVGVVGFLGLAIWQLAEAVVGAPGRRQGRLGWPGQGGRQGRGLPRPRVVGLQLRPRQVQGQPQPERRLHRQAARQAGRPRPRRPHRARHHRRRPIYHVYKGWTRSSSRTCRTTPARGRPGRAGSATSPRASRWSSSGFLFAAAGFHKQAKEASGLDGALKSLRDEPFGTVLLVIMAIGFAAFGLYSFSRAKHAKV